MTDLEKLIKECVKNIKGNKDGAAILDQHLQDVWNKTNFPVLVEFGRALLKLAWRGQQLDVANLDLSTPEARAAVRAALLKLDDA